MPERRLRILLHEDPHNPYYNLALDEALLETATQHPTTLVLRIWRNPPSVILGAGSSIKGEVDTKCTQSHNIPVARRITGGGTVYHDHGNTNYTLIVGSRIAHEDRAGKDSLEYIYGHLLRGLLRALQLLGLSPRTANTSDVVVKGYKVSGNAATIRKNTYLLHGTLLVNADIEKIYRCLIIPPRNTRHRGRIDPVKYRVANLEQLAREKLAQTKIVDTFVKAFSETLGAKPYYDTLTPRELAKTKQLLLEKHSSPQWINRHP